MRPSRKLWNSSSIRLLILLSPISIFPSTRNIVDVSPDRPSISWRLPPFSCLPALGAITNNTARQALPWFGNGWLLAEADQRTGVPAITYPTPYAHLGQQRTNASSQSLARGCPFPRYLQDETRPPPLKSHTRIHFSFLLPRTRRLGKHDGRGDCKRKKGKGGGGD